MRDSFVQSGLGALVGAAVLAASLTLSGNLSVGGTGGFTGSVGIGVSPDSRYALYAYKAPAAATVGNRTGRFNHEGTYNTTAGAITAYGMSIVNEATRSAGAFSLTNYALYLNASGGQSNTALVTDEGDVQLNATSGTTTVAGSPVLTQASNIPNDFMYGTGYDGDCNFDGTSVACGMTPAAGVYTMTRPLYANNITGTAIVETAGWPVLAQGTMGTNTVTFRRNANSASGSTAGASLASGYNPGSLGGASGQTNSCANVATATTAAVLFCPTNTATNAGNGGGTQPTTGTVCRGGGGGGSTVSGSGSSGGQVTQGAVASDAFLPASATGAFSVGIVQWGMNTGGGCGAGDGVSLGGGGGGGGPWNIIYARNCGSGLFTVQSRGGNGAGRGATCTNPGRGCAGGGGGSGGVIKVLCGAGTVPSRASFKLDASPGCGGAGSGPVPGQNGASGGSGYILTYSPATGWVHSFDSTPWTVDGGGSCPVP